MHRPTPSNLLALCTRLGLPALIALLTVNGALASDLAISDPIVYVENDQAWATFNIQWEHAWNNDKNHDAVWMCFKSLPYVGAASHVRVLPTGHSVEANFAGENAAPSIRASKDSVGLFVVDAPQISLLGLAAIVLGVLLGKNARRDAFRYRAAKVRYQKKRAQAARA